MTEHQILGLIAFAQVVLTVYGIIEIRRAAGLFKAGVDLVVLYTTAGQASSGAR